MRAETRFSLEDANRAYDEWGANCGPGAVAAVCHLSLDQVRPHLVDFEKKRYTNPLMMWSILDSIEGISWHPVKPLGWPVYGLVRVQWHGPWMAAGVPVRRRYRHTHWIGTVRSAHGRGVFDINCMRNGTGWVSLEDWEKEVVPWLVKKEVTGGDGEYSITHGVEISIQG